MSVSRTELVKAARAWIGTPYRHQASVRGHGADCLGVVRGVWRACIGPEPEAVTPYCPDWAVAGEPEALAQALSRHFCARKISAAAPGDVLAFRMAADAPLKHAAILSECGTLLHAYWGREVVESRFAPWWRSRLGSVFSFPGALPWPS
jgi:NlpC/P60 family putative phage cell wall peptidase